jgi:hypothetical protein
MFLPLWSSKELHFILFHHCVSTPFALRCAANCRSSSASANQLSGLVPQRLLVSNFGFAAAICRQLWLCRNEKKRLCCNTTNVPMAKIEVVAIICGDEPINGGKAGRCREKPNVSIIPYPGQTDTSVLPSGKWPLCLCRKRVRGWLTSL